MPTKPLDRLMFIQGGLCFFCEQPLPKAEASVEHLLASANGGDNGDENCVACCKSVNALFGRMPLKEKFQVVLNQKGNFKCPKGVPTAPEHIVAPLTKTATKLPVQDNARFSQIVSNLKQRGNSRPRTLKTLAGTISNLFPQGLPKGELEKLIHQLQATGKVAVADNKVSYKL